MNLVSSLPGDLLYPMSESLESDRWVKKNLEPEEEKLRFQSKRGLVYFQWDRFAGNIDIINTSIYFLKTILPPPC